MKSESSNIVTPTITNSQKSLSSHLHSIVVPYAIILYKFVEAFQRIIGIKRKAMMKDTHGLVKNFSMKRMIFDNTKKSFWREKPFYYWPNTNGFYVAN